MYSRRCCCFWLPWCRHHKRESETSFRSFPPIFYNTNYLLLALPPSLRYYYCDSWRWLLLLLLLFGSFFMSICFGICILAPCRCFFHSFVLFFLYGYMSFIWHSVYFSFCHLCLSFNEFAECVILLWSTLLSSSSLSSSSSSLLLLLLSSSNLLN